MTKEINPPQFSNLISQSTMNYCRLWDNANLAPKIQVKFSNRITRSLGRTQPAAKIIRLNPLLQTRLRHLLEEVLCHELAHIAAHHLHGDAIRPHGLEWQTLMRVASYEPRVRIEADLGPPPAHQSRCYTHRCPVCHAVRVAKKRMVHWRCAECVANGLEGIMEIEGEK